MIQTNPDGTPAPPAPQPPAPGLLRTWKLLEPVRLYLWGLATVVLLALAITGALTGAWVGLALTAVGVLLGLGGAAEAIRASVFSPAAMMGLVIAHRGRHLLTVPTRESDA
jgi:membrane protein implicated in regulation of membrane protease activity